MKGSHCRTELLGLFDSTSQSPSNRYCRIFPGRTDFPEHSDELEDQLKRIAAAMAEADEPDKPQLRPPSAYTYFGQFIDHDISHDRTTLKDLSKDPDASVNASSARLDLDQIYGRGFEGQRNFFEDDGRFRLGMTITVEVPFKGVWAESLNDLYRSKVSKEGDPDKWMTTVADERADQNLMLAQMHVAFMKAHNRFLQDKKVLDSPHFAHLYPFDAARKCLTWHYQWMIVNDFLPKWATREIVEEALNNSSTDFPLNFGDGPTPQLPIEINAAVFRIGHTLVRDRYTLSRWLRSISLTQLCTDFVGKPIPATQVIDWPLFFGQAAGSKQNFARKFDTHVVQTLGDLDLLGIEPTTPAMPDLIARTLIRGMLLRLPTGQQLATMFGTPILVEELRATSAGPLLAEFGLLKKTPLFYYLLAEAQLLKLDDRRPAGNRLGPLGAKLLVNTLIGLLKADDDSYLSPAATGWKPDERIVSAYVTNKLLGLIEYGQGGPRGSRTQSNT